MDGIQLYVREDFTGLGDVLAGENEVFLVYDRNVEWAAQDILGQLSQIRATMAIEASEACKTMDTVLSICRFLLENNADRRALVLALGGGVTTDMAGFAALIYKRGVRYANLPTTLLSQVDAGIGGKTGVNLDGYKNILGRIQQPEFVYAAQYTLRTLPDEEYRSGLAEMLKTFIIADAPHFRRAMGFVRGGRLLEDWDGRPVDVDGRECAAARREDWAGGPVNEGDGRRTARWVDCELITAAARIKIGIVERDEFETGERRVLNLGHTVGHAIEWWQAEEKSAGKRYSHGEAVAIGTVMAAKLSEALGVCEKGLAAQLEKDFEDAGLPTKCPVPLGVIENAIRRDKKAEGDSVHYVLIKEIGRVEVRLMPVESIIHYLEIASI